MDTDEIQTKLNELRDIDLDPVKQQINDFIDALPTRYAEALDQIKRQLGLKPRTRREAMGQWINEHRWVPILLGVGLVAAAVLGALARTHLAGEISVR